MQPGELVAAGPGEHVPLTGEQFGQGPVLKFETAYFLRQPGGADRLVDHHRRARPPQRIALCVPGDLFDHRCPGRGRDGQIVVALDLW
ncbi:hypothetical protein [Streptomyces yangpuensis]|uniref:hypothetical protein n=1 Tax=Streptomyces yangpuensis TaxID=1648182 RepID=UPI003720D127